MIDIYENAKRDLGYVATRFLQLVSGKGGVEAAREPITSSRPSAGFTTLWENHRLDLSVERLVLEPAYESLFTAHERDLALKRLHDYGYDPPTAAVTRPLASGEHEGKSVTSGQ